MNDASLFLLINRLGPNALFDFVMPFISAKTYLLILAIVIFPMIKDWRKALPFLVLLGICIFISDTTGNMLKNIFERARPCKSIEAVRLLVSCTSSFSFPSNHAVNVFAAAAISSYFYKKTLPLLYLVAVSVSFSRIYIGVHYPSDVCAGALWGTLCAFIVLGLYTKLRVPAVSR